MELSTPGDSAMIHLSPHESSNPLHSTLHQSFSLLQKSHLTPPFSLQIPTPSHYQILTHALAYALLTQPQPRLHLAHLHATVLDGYRLFTATLTQITARLYPSLLPRPRFQLLSLLPVLIDVDAVGADDLVIAVLRRIESGDFSGQNLWLAGELVRVLFEKWEWTVETPGVVASGLFVFLRLLADHWRLTVSGDLEVLKRREVEFCVRALREEFGLCLGIGRDLIRLLQDVVFVPELGDVWRDMLCNPGAFGVAGFEDVGQLCRTRTPSRYFLLMVSVEMETRLRFLLTHVKWGSQMRYLEWFGRKFLCRPEQETVIVDLVRFVCCAHHPSNEIIRSDVYSRWALIGWLLKCCKKNYFEANAKLALFYDWLFFDEKVDNIMNIEPAVLLMVHSLPKYADLTNTLMEFLFLLVDNYDTNRKDMISHSVSESFRLLVKKGVVSSLSPLTSHVMVAPMMRQRLTTFLSAQKLETVNIASTLSKSRSSCGGFGFGVVKKSGTRSRVPIDKSDDVSDEFDKEKLAMSKLQAINNSGPGFEEFDKELFAPSEPESVDKSPALGKSEMVKESLVISKLEAIKESSQPSAQLTVPRDVQMSACNATFCFGVAEHSLKESIVPTVNKRETVREGCGQKIFALTKSEAVKKSPSLYKSEMVNKSILSKLEAVNESSVPITQLRIPWNLEFSASRGIFSFGSEKNLAKCFGVTLNKSEVVNKGFSKELFARTTLETVSISPTSSKPESVKELLLTDKLESIQETSAPSTPLTVTCYIGSSAKDRILDISAGKNSIEDLGVIVEKLKAEDNEFGQKSSALSKSEAVNKSAALGTSELVKEPQITSKFEAVKGTSCLSTQLAIPNEAELSSSTCSFGVLKDLLKDLRVTIKQSIECGLKALENLLISFATLDAQVLDIELGGNSSKMHQALAFQITEAFKSVGQAMFLPLDSFQEGDHDDEIHSATAAVLQAYIFYPHERMRDVILFWSRNGCPVGARLLSYASRLAYEERKLGRLRNANAFEEDAAERSQLQYHIDQSLSFKIHGTKDSSNGIPVDRMDFKLVKELVEGTFIAYRSLLMSLIMDQPSQHVRTQSRDNCESVSCEGPRGMDQALPMSLISDLRTCLQWNLKRSTEFFSSIFCYLSDLCTSKVQFVQIIVDMLDQVDVVAMQFELSLKRFCIFGEDSCSIFNIVKDSLHWKVVKQRKLWDLLVSEMLVSNVKVEELIVSLCRNCIKPTAVAHSVAIEGLFSLTRCCFPTPELIGTMMALPNIFGDFAAAVLSCWAIRNSSVFGINLAEWLQTLKEKEVVVCSSKDAVKLNRFVIESLLQYFDGHGINNLSSSNVSSQELKKLLHLVKDDDVKTKKRKRTCLS